MQSKASTVSQYIAELPADRRAIIAAVRDVIRTSIDPKIEERMAYGMIGYAVPHSIFPAGYHCDPVQPLPVAGLASQKNACSLYMMALYIGGDTDEKNPELKWFRQAWAKSGKKLDMGKACIRFKSIDDLPMDVIAQAFKRFSISRYVAAYTAALPASAKRGSSGKQQRAGSAKPAAKAAKPIAPKAKAAKANAANVGLKKVKGTRQRTRR